MVFEKAASDRSQQQRQRENLAKTKLNLLRRINNATEERRLHIESNIAHASTPMPTRKKVPITSTKSTLSHALDIPSLASHCQMSNNNIALPQSTWADAAEKQQRSHCSLPSSKREHRSTATSTPISTRLPTPSTPSTFRFDDSGNSVDVGNVKFDMLDIASSHQAQLALDASKVLLEPNMEDSRWKGDYITFTPDVPIEAVLDFSFIDEPMDRTDGAGDQSLHLEHPSCHHQEEIMRFGGDTSQYYTGELDTSPTYHLSKQSAAQLQAPLTSMCGLLLQQAAHDKDIDVDSGTSLSSGSNSLGLLLQDPREPLTSSDTNMMEPAEMERGISSSSLTSIQTERAANYIDSSFSSCNVSPCLSQDIAWSSNTDEHDLSTTQNHHWVHGQDTPPRPSSSLGAPLMGPRSRSSFEDGRNNLHPGRWNPLRSNSATEWSSGWPKSNHAAFFKSGAKMSYSLSDDPASGHLLPPVDLYRLNRPRSSLSVHHQSTQQTRQPKESSETSLDLGPIPRSTRGYANESSFPGIGPLRSGRIANTTVPNGQAKRLSASFVSDYGSRRAHQEKQDRFDQVSDALQTLRTFLHQREGVMTPQKERRGIDLIDIDAMPSLQPKSRFTDVAASRWSEMGSAASQDSVYDFQSHLQSPLSPKSTEADHIAALDDLARRVRQMKHNNEQCLAEE